jgi:hypothetical protein
VAKLESDIAAAMDALKQLETDAMEVGPPLPMNGIRNWAIRGRLPAREGGARPMGRARRAPASRSRRRGKMCRSRPAPRAPGPGPRRRCAQVMTRVEELQAAKEGADKGLEEARHAKEQKQKEVGRLVIFL